MDPHRRVCTRIDSSGIDKVQRRELKRKKFSEWSNRTVSLSYNSSVVSRSKIRNPVITIGGTRVIS
ncbi:MAG: hypothetical protein IPG73_13445 [Ignavibacteria bacterium]|nr:hypothetical protein [Ignavibacteria bacterium]